MSQSAVGAVEPLLAFAGQWVAGSRPEDALRRARESNARGVGAILNLLGEHHTTRSEVEADAQAYASLLGSIRDAGLDACISVKLSQLGLDIDEAYCGERVADLRERCREAGAFLWLDMEGTAYTAATLRIYRETLARYPEVGVCLQANLRRTAEDLRGLLPQGIVRLCKGAYREPAAVAYRSRTEVDASYSTLMHILFRQGRRFALATHDDRLVRTGMALQAERPREVEFQMLLGVRDALKAALRDRGQRVLEYVPFGPQWLPYFTRRLQERPRNLITMARAFVGA